MQGFMVRKIVNLIRLLCGIYDKLLNKALLKYRGVQVGNNVRIVGRFCIYGKGKISIGHNCLINCKFSYNPITGCGQSSFTTKGEGRVVVVNNVKMSSVQLYSAAKITIEDNVMLGSGVKIWDTDFHSLDYVNRMSNDSFVVNKPVVISEGAFIGANSIILKGVTVGKHSIVGAGSVVTKNVPDYQIWAGNPATFIRNIEE